LVEWGWSRRTHEVQCSHGPFLHPASAVRRLYPRVLVHPTPLRTSRAGSTDPS